MTTPLYLQDAYQTSAAGTVTWITEQGGITLDQSLFYATSGGQPGDSGTLTWDDLDIEIAATIKGEGGSIALIPAEEATRPAVGQAVTQNINWDMRYAHAYGVAFIVGGGPTARHRRGHHSHQGAFGFRHARGTR